MNANPKLNIVYRNGKAIDFEDIEYWLSILRTEGEIYIKIEDKEVPSLTKMVVSSITIVGKGAE